MVFDKFGFYRLLERKKSGQLGLGWMKKTLLNLMQRSNHTNFDCLFTI